MEQKGIWGGSLQSVILPQDLFVSTSSVSHYLFLKQVLPKDEIARIRVGRKFQKISLQREAHPNERNENCQPKKGKKQLGAD